MKFPQTNKIHQKQPIEDKIGDNMKALEDIISSTDWRFILKAYFVFLSVFLVSIFFAIVVIKGALSFF